MSVSCFCRKHVVFVAWSFCVSFLVGCGPNWLNDSPLESGSVGAAIWGDKHYSLVESLKSEHPGIRVENDHIRTHTGERYDLIQGNSVYLGQLYQLRDTKRAQQVWDFYQRHVLSFLSQDLVTLDSTSEEASKQAMDKRDLEKRLEYWVFEKAIYLGVDADRSQRLFLDDNYFEDLWRTNDSFRQAMKGFFADLACSLEVVDASSSQNRQKRVYIATTSGFGGGHLSTGRSMESFLKRSGYKVKLGDTLRIRPEKDPLYIFTGALHEEMVYEKYFQHQNDMGRAMLVWDLFNRLRRFVPSNSTFYLQQDVQKFQPDFILAPIHNRPELFQVAYQLNIPMLLVSTDYELQHLLPNIIGDLDPAIARVTVTTKQPNFFMPTVRDPQKLESQPKGRSYLQAMKEFTSKSSRLEEEELLEPDLADDKRWQNFQKKAPVFELMGLPVHEQIKLVEGEHQLQEIRQRFGILADERVMLVTMGKQADSQIMKILAQFEKYASIFRGQKIAVLVLSGANTELHDYLSRRKKDWALGSGLRMLPCRRLSAAEMSQVYSVADLVVTKPGGASTTELVKMGKYALIPSWYVWEEGNLNFMRDLGLAKGVDIHKSPLSFVREAALFFERLENQAVEGFCSGKCSLKVARNVLSDWRKDLVRIIENW